MTVVTPILLLTNLRAQTGGLHQAIYLRLEALHGTFPKTKLLTMDYDRRFDSNLEASIQRNNVPGDVEVLNSYRWFMNAMPSARRSAGVTGAVPQNELTPYQRKDGRTPAIRYLDSDNDKHEGYRCFENGIYRRYEGFVEGKLDFVDHFSPAWVREEKHLYGREGKVECIIHMDPVLNKPKLKRYIDPCGECFLSVRVNPKTGTEGPFFLHRYQKQFTTYWQFVWFWIDLVAKNQEGPVLFLDKRELIDSAARSSYKNIYVLHSSHLLHSVADTRVLVPSLLPMVKNIERIDRIVVLTPNQREDLIVNFGIRQDKVVAIPHCQKTIQGIKPMRERAGNKIVTIARYHPVKALHEAIHAFRKVLASVPDATYDIYGYGPLRDDLQKLINSLGIGSQVNLRGFSTDYVKCFSSAKGSVLTSLNEGFGVVIAESMACGTPVVSYETDFGPRYLVRNGVDGYLVKMGDQDLLAKRIVDLLVDEEKCIRFSEAALEITERLDEKRYSARWSALVMEV